MGHTKAAAGIGGFIKAVLSVNRRIIAPTIGCEQPHDAFQDVARALYPVTQGRVLDHRDTVRAGVPATGFGGINCHVTLESADAPAPELDPGVPEADLLRSYRTHECYLLSAPSVEAMRERVSDLAERARGMAVCEGADLAAELAAGVSPDTVRAALVADTPDALASALTWLAAQLADDVTPGLHRTAGAWLAVGDVPQRVRGLADLHPPKRACLH